VAPAAFRGIFTVTSWEQLSTEDPHTLESTPWNDCIGILEITRVYYRLLRV